MSMGSLERDTVDVVGPTFWEETRVNSNAMARQHGGWRNAEPFLSVDREEAVPLRYRADEQRALGKDAYSYWPGIECAGPHCARMAVEGYYFCSHACRDAWRHVTA